MFKQYFNVRRVENALLHYFVAPQMACAQSYKLFSAKPERKIFRKRIATAYHRHTFFAIEKAAACSKVETLIGIFFHRASPCKHLADAPVEIITVFSQLLFFLFVYFHFV